MDEAKPLEGELRGVGIRKDPQGILFSPHTENGVQWGFTIVNRNEQPQIFLKGEWKTIIPDGVWQQMLGLWDDMLKSIKENPNDVKEYLEYKEIAEGIKRV